MPVSDLRDAAFVVLVVGGDAEREAVREELLWQVAAPGTDFADGARWCVGRVHDKDPNFHVAGWATKLLLAYDYLGRDAFTAAERDRIDEWFRAVAVYLQSDLDLAFEKRFDVRGASNVVNRVYQDGWCDRVLYLDGPITCSLHRSYNNRHANMARLVGLVGVYLDDPSLRASARQFTEEFLRYGVFPDGGISDLQRWTERLPDLGWAYAASTVGSVLTIADAFARDGDPSLYEYTTSDGAMGSQGGEKSLRFAARSIVKHSTGAFERYGTDDPANRGDVDYRIDGRNEATSWYGVNEIFLAPANRYLDDPLISSGYTRTGPGLNGYPSSPAAGSGGTIWTGESYIYPGVLFMYGDPSSMPLIF